MTKDFSPDAPRELVFILGMHRSGTSALARVLNLGGFCLSKDLLGPNQDNPLGFWEPKTIVKLNTQLLQQFDRHWADPKPMPEGWAEQFMKSNGVATVREVLQEEMAAADGQSKLMVIKDPRLSRVMPAWQPALRQLGTDTVCLIACRNPLDVYQSLKARDRFEANHALDLWLSYMLEAESVTRGMRRVVVHYDDLLADWRKTLLTINSTTHLPAMTLSDVMERQIDTFLRKDLRHHQLAITELDEETPLHAMVKATYELYIQHNTLAATEAFDELNRHRKMRWSKRSPGDGGSGIIYQMSSWYVEQAWDFIASNDDLKALTALDTAIDMSSDVARYHFIRGNVLERMGNPEAALEARCKAIQLDDNVPRFHRAYCQNLNQLGLYEEAADAFGVLARLEPSASNHHQHGNWLARVDRQNEAVTAQLKAIKLKSTQRSFHVALAGALHRLGRKMDACGALIKAIELGPPSANLYDQLGHLYAGLGKNQESTRVIDKAVELRCQLLGFRKTRVGKRLTDNKANARNQLLCLLARLGTRHWAQDLADRLKHGGNTVCDQVNAWPLSKEIQFRPFVPIVEHDQGNPEPAPLLSIMIPVYGIENMQWLHTCVSSVLSQDQGTDWAEIVIVDDASTDDTAQSIAKAYAPRVRYTQNLQNLGLVGNHNHCISIARGTFIHILHQDDYVAPGFYEALLEPMLHDESLVAGFTHNRFINSEGKALSKTDPPRPLLGVLESWHIRLSLECRIQFPSIIVRRSSYQKAGGFYSGRKFSFDWDLWNRIASLGPVWYDPRPLAQYRIHESSATHGFDMKFRVVDSMQTVASMLQLLPGHLHRSTAEMGMYKFFERYWRLIADMPFHAISPERSELVDFLLTGWTNEQERDQILALLHELTN